jgi:hypothetical protein
VARQGGHHAERGSPDGELARSEDPEDDLPACTECIAAGASKPESTLLHLEDGAPEPVYVPDFAPSRAGRAEREREVRRLRQAGFSRESAELAVTPYRSSGTGWPQGVICR